MMRKLLDIMYKKWVVHVVQLPQSTTLLKSYHALYVLVFFFTSTRILKNAICPVPHSRHNTTVKPTSSLWLLCMHFMRMIQTCATSRYLLVFFFLEGDAERFIWMPAQAHRLGCLFAVAHASASSCMCIQILFLYHSVSNNTCISCSIPPMKVVLV